MQHISKKQIKHWEHKLVTYVYNHCNICNILIYFCNIHIKHLQHTYETSERLKRLKHAFCNVREAEAGRFQPSRSEPAASGGAPVAVREHHHHQHRAWLGWAGDARDGRSEEQLQRRRASTTTTSATGTGLGSARRVEHAVAVQARQRSHGGARHDGDSRVGSRMGAGAAAFRDESESGVFFSNVG